MIASVCPRCHDPLSGSAPAGFCPRCAGRLLLDTSEAVEDGFGGSQPSTLNAQRLPLRLGEYELGAELGRGAMGVVYRARQPRLRREVAVKVILASRFAGESARKRFLAEAELAAQLDHPNIVPIYEVGETPDGPFYAMKLIEGGTLAEVIENWKLRIENLKLQSAGHSPPANSQFPILNSQFSMATLLATVARAVHHAHQRGVLHRDLKPGNILLDGQGEPHIADFGVARQLGVESSLTLTGSTLGTPAYMAPEQAAGERGITTAADVWSLGAILFHLLTARPPFIGATPTDILLQARTQEAPRLRPLNPRIPGDLETICLKCLEKDPARRYSSALRLAEDLERWQRHEPIEARPVSSVERLAKWARRRPAVAALTVAVFIAAVIGVAGIAWQWRRAERIAEESRDRLVRLYQINAQRAVDEAGEPVGALPWLAAALVGEPADSPRRSVICQNLASVLRDSVIPEQVWQLRHHADEVRVSPDGAWVAAHEGLQFAQVWDIRTGQALFAPDRLVGSYNTVFSPDSRRIAFGGGDSGRIYELPSGKEVKARLTHKAAVSMLTFSPDSRWLATASADKTARVWDATTGEPVTEPLQHLSSVSCVAFSPDGKHIATVDHTGAASIWEIATGRELRRLEVGGFGRVRFSLDGKYLLVLSGHNKPWVYETETLRPVGQPVASGWIQRAMFSPDGLRAVSEADGGARVWDVITARAITPTLIHGGGIYCLDFSPDGRVVATGGKNGKARVWDATTGEPLTPWLHLGGLVNSVQFTPDSQHLVTGSYDGTVRVWPWQRSPSREIALAGQTNVLVQLWAAPDQPRLLTLDRTGSIRLWSTETGQPLTPECGDGTPPANFRISPDGKRFLAGGKKAVQVWNVGTGAPGLRIERAIEGLGMEWHPRGKSILEGASSARINEWDTASGTKLRAIKANASKSPALAVSGAAGLLGAADGDRVHLWNPDSTNSRYSQSLPGIEFEQVRFSPDGHLLAAVTPDGIAALFDTKSLALKADPLRHAAPIDHFEFSPDSRCLATASRDGVVRLWESATGRLLSPTLRSPGGANRISFSPDGRLLATSAVFTCQIWDLATGLPVTMLFRFEHELVGGANFAADSSSVLLVTRDARVFRRELQTPDLASADWQFAAGWFSGHTVSEKGELEPWQPGPETESIWRKLRQRLAPLRTYLALETSPSPKRATHLNDETPGGWSNTASFSFASPRHRPWTNNFPLRDPATPPHLIDLTRNFNFGLTNSLHDIDVDNSLSALRPGVRHLGGVDFDVRGLIYLPASKTDDSLFARRVMGIKVGRKTSALHFLHACGWNAADGTHIGSFEVHYVDGRKHEIPIIYGRDVRDWHPQPNERPDGANSREVWQGTNAASRAKDVRIRLFKTTWSNPLPDVEIVRLDYVSKMTAAAPFLLAITAE